MVIAYLLFAILAYERFHRNTHFQTSGETCNVILKNPNNSIKGKKGGKENETPRTQVKNKSW